MDKDKRKQDKELPAKLNSSEQSDRSKHHHSSKQTTKAGRRLLPVVIVLAIIIAGIAIMFNQKLLVQNPDEQLGLEDIDDVEQAYVIEGGDIVADDYSLQVSTARADQVINLTECFILTGWSEDVESVFIVTDSQRLSARWQVEYFDIFTGKAIAYRELDGSILFSPLLPDEMSLGDDCIPIRLYFERFEDEELPENETTIGALINAYYSTFGVLNIHPIEEDMLLLSPDVQVMPIIQDEEEYFIIATELVSKSGGRDSRIVIDLLTDQTISLSNSFGETEWLIADIAPDLSREQTAFSEFFATDPQLQKISNLELLELINTHPESDKFYFLAW